MLSTSAWSERKPKSHDIGGNVLREAAIGLLSGNGANLLPYQFLARIFLFYGKPHRSSLGDFEVDVNLEFVLVVKRMRQLKILYQITNRNSPSLLRYFQEVNSKEMISPEEEVLLAQRIREGDMVALERLTQANLRFVISVAKQYDKGGHNLTLGDLISEGNIGLITAATKFDETRGFKFISYAVWWIRQAIMSAISQNSRLIRQPMNRVMSFNKMLRSFSELEQQLQREPTDEELAEALDMPEDHVKSMKNISSRPASIDAPLRSDEVFNLLDVLPEMVTPSPEQGLMHTSLQVDISHMLAQLTDREARIITWSFGLNDTPRMRLEDIGNELGLTRERVRQVRETALKKMKDNQQGLEALKSYIG